MRAIILAAGRGSRMKEEKQLTNPSALSSCTVKG